MSNQSQYRLIAVDGKKLHGDLAGKRVPGFSELSDAVRAECGTHDVDPNYQPPLEFVERFIDVMKREHDPTDAHYRLDFQPREAILCIGEPGTGKTSFLRHVSACTGLPYVRCSVDAETHGAGLIVSRSIREGSETAVFGPIGRAMRLGVPCQVNEFNHLRHDLVGKLLDATEDGWYRDSETGLSIKAERGFFLVGTMNPPASMEGALVNKGTRDLTEALSSRFTEKWTFEPLDSAALQKVLLGSVPGLSKGTAATLCAVADRVRAAASNTAKLIAQRQLINWARKVVREEARRQKKEEREGIDTSKWPPAMVTTFSFAVAGDWPPAVTQAVIQIIREEGSKAKTASKAPSSTPTSGTG